MSTLLLILAGYIVLDRLLTVGKVGDYIEITPGFAVASVITGALFVILLVSAALNGVAP
jgi:hypothetical protein